MTITLKTIVLCNDNKFIPIILLYSQEEKLILLLHQE